MTSSDAGRAGRDDLRLLGTLQRVLAIQDLDFRGALTQACNQIAGALGCEKVDIFLYEAERESLVALGTSQTDVGRRQRRIGMDYQPLANGGAVVRVFQTGEPYVTGHAEQDPDQLRGMIEGLGVRSEIGVPFDVQGERRGVLSAISVQHEFFAEADLPFLQAVANWIGMVTHRTELIEQATRGAARLGRREAAEDLARLTRRQQEVATCIAGGLSNASIAQRLVLSEGTAANHVEAILRRLGLSSRTQIAVWAVERGLYRSEGKESAGEAANRAQWQGRSVGHQPAPPQTDAPVMGRSMARVDDRSPSAGGPNGSGHQDATNGSAVDD
jgi:DNA-binding CsgD family transcriptional regulator